MCKLKSAVIHYNVHPSVSDGKKTLIGRICSRPDFHIRCDLSTKAPIVQKVGEEEKSKETIESKKEFFFYSSVRPSIILYVIVTNTVSPLSLSLPRS